LLGRPSGFDLDHLAEKGKKGKVVTMHVYRHIT